MYKGALMKIICSQVYIRVKREITSNQQHYIKTEEYLHLFEDRIHANNKHYLLKDIFDISFKSFSSNHGFLYLHTNQGVFSFLVQENPQPFIKWFKVLK